MLKARKYVVKKPFDGVPKRDDFEIVEYELPALKDGEILVKAEWISVDPFLHASNELKKLPYNQHSLQLGTVQKSKEPSYPVGTKVVSHMGWCDYCIINPKLPDPLNVIMYKMPDLQGLREPLALGAVGMIGVTAYFGLLNICKPNPGETVVVNAAAGAVGSVVGQIAKIKGCRVIGFTGSDKKVKWLEQELGYDKAFNYKTVNVTEALKQAAPNGVDCYFDNVGGEISSQIIDQMNLLGRIAVCGCISAYNDNSVEKPKATILQPAIAYKKLKVEGLNVMQWQDRINDALAQLLVWVKSGQLKGREHVWEGFDKMYDAFIGMLKGENFGKAMVKV